MVEPEERRQAIAKLYFEERLSQTEIAKRLDVSRSTIKREIETIVALWRDNNAEVIQQVRAERLHDLHLLLNEAMKAWLSGNTNPRLLSEARYLIVQISKLMGFETLNIDLGGEDAEPIRIVEVVVDDTD